MSYADIDGACTVSLEGADQIEVHSHNGLPPPICREFPVVNGRDGIFGFYTVTFQGLVFICGLLFGYVVIVSVIPDVIGCTTRHLLGSTPDTVISFTIYLVSLNN